MKSNKIKHIPHDRKWELLEAENHLSQVVNSALIDGAQTITLRGKPIVVVVSIEEYCKLTPSPSLSQFFRQSPLHDIELELNRSSDLPRETTLLNP